MIGREAIFRLLPDRQGPCVSLYVPTNDATDGDQDSIRFDNLLRCMENDLEANGHVVDADSLFSKVVSHRMTASFWDEPNEATVAFLAPAFTCIEHLPYPVAMQYRIDRRFHILPLLPLVDPYQRFFVLSLNQERVQFFAATPHSITEINLVGSPSSLSTSARLPGNTSRSTHAPPAGFSKPGNALAKSMDSQTGATSTMIEQHSELLDSLRAIDHQLRQILVGERAPLVLAGFGFIASLYEGINSYRYLLPMRIPGSPSNWTVDELHAHAVEIVMPFLDRDRQQTLSAFDSDSAQHDTTIDVAELLTAAGEHRVEMLFIARRGECDGHYDAFRHAVTFDLAGDDLRELAASSTLLGGGEVCVVDRDLMPDRKVLAAILRTKSTKTIPR